MSGDGVLVITAWVDGDGRLRARVRNSDRTGPEQLDGSCEIALASRAAIVEHVDAWLQSF